MKATATQKHTAASTRSRQRGMSLVELMVGVTIGLFIVAAATLLLGHQLSDNRRLLLETQLQQDMRVSMDIITRQIRRAGVYEPDDSLNLMSSPTGQPGRFSKAFRRISLGAGNEEIVFNYFLNPDSQADTGIWGFKLEAGKVRTKLAGAGWQDLTDGSTVKVTKLLFTPVSNTSEVVACPNLCPDTTTACWPRSMVRSYRVTLEAESVADPLVKRRMQTLARVRNNLPVFNADSETQPCP